MAIVGHGPSQSDCPDCYGVAIATSKDSSLVDFKITGRYGYQGLLLLVKDVETNKTVGEFQKFDDERFTSVACDDDEDEADQIDPDSYAVLGHIDPKIKEWPVDVSWGLESVPKNIKLKLQGMVVVSDLWLRA
jgi:hypothetical protein